MLIASVERPHLMLSPVSPFFKANSEGASLALAMSTKCSALCGLKKRENKYVLQYRVDADVKHVRLIYLLCQKVKKLP